MSSPPPAGSRPPAPGPAGSTPPPAAPATGAAPPSARVEPPPPAPASEESAKPPEPAALAPQPTAARAPQAAAAPAPQAAAAPDPAATPSPADAPAASGSDAPASRPASDPVASASRPASDPGVAASRPASNPVASASPPADVPSVSGSDDQAPSPAAVPTGEAAGSAPAATPGAGATLAPDPAPAGAPPSAGPPAATSPPPAAPDAPSPPDPPASTAPPSVPAAAPPHPAASAAPPAPAPSAVAAPPRPNLTIMAPIRTPSAAPTFVEIGAIRAAGEAAGLTLPDAVYANVAAALNAGKHLLLTGAPGCGKTWLALAVTRAAAQVGRARGATVVTGAPASDLIVDAATRGRWLIVDELDQSDPDEAFAGLSSFLGGVPITRDERESAPAEGWRMIATWNGEPPRAAILRRFAIVEVLPPADEDLAALLHRAAGGDKPAVSAAMRLREAGVGTGVLLDAARHAAARNATTPTDEATLAREVFQAYAAPMQRA